jgi:hypothetical protein
MGKSKEREPNLQEIEDYGEMVETTKHKREVKNVIIVITITISILGFLHIID